MGLPLPTEDEPIDITDFLETCGRGTLPFPPGTIGSIAEYIFAQSLYPIAEVATLAALLYFAGKVGRAYNVSGMGLNQYGFNIMDTGMGKGAAINGMATLDALVRSQLADKHTLRKGPGQLPSMQGLRNALVGTEKKKPRLCCLTINDEVGHFLQRLYDSRATMNERDLRGFLLSLYTSSGGNKTIDETIYADAAKNVGELIAPAWSWLGGSTPDVFYQIVNNEAVNEGLVPRCHIIEYKGPIPNSNEQFCNAKVPEWLIHDLKERTVSAKWLEDQQDMNAFGMREWVNVTFDSETTEWNRELEQHIREKRQSLRESNQRMLAALWSRVQEKLYRVAALVAVGSTHPGAGMWSEVGSPVITRDAYLWALDFTLRGSYSVMDRIETGETGEPNLAMQRNTAMEKCIQRYLERLKDAWTLNEFTKEFYIRPEMVKAKVITWRYISKYLLRYPAYNEARCGFKRAIEETIEMFIKDERLKAVVPGDPLWGDYKGRTNCWYILDSRFK
jgi:hypothetical protein